MTSVTNPFWECRVSCGYPPLRTGSNLREPLLFVLFNWCTRNCRRTIDRFGKTIFCSLGDPMSAEAVPLTSAASVSERLKNATEELRLIQEQLVSGTVDPRILTDFRDAVNRVRTTAWAVQHSLGSQEPDSQGLSVISLLAGERVRVAYQMCRLIAADLANNGMTHGSGKLVKLYLAVGDLTRQLEHILGRETDGWLTRTVAAHDAGSAG